MLHACISRINSDVKVNLFFTAAAEKPFKQKTQEQEDIDWTVLINKRTSTTLFSV